MAPRPPLSVDAAPGSAYAAGARGAHLPLLLSWRRRSVRIGLCQRRKVLST